MYCTHKHCACVMLLSRIKCMRFCTLALKTAENGWAINPGASPRGFIKGYASTYMYNV